MIWKTDYCWNTHMLTQAKLTSKIRASLISTMSSAPVTLHPVTAESVAAVPLRGNQFLLATLSAQIYDPFQFRAQISAQCVDAQWHSPHLAVGMY
jgi:hypothetical protein